MSIVVSARYIACYVQRVDLNAFVRVSVMGARQRCVTYPHCIWQPPLQPILIIV